MGSGAFIPSTVLRRWRVLTRRVPVLLLAVWLSCAAIPALAQQDQQPLTNNDVVKMVKSGLPASIIVNAIQANQTNFDVSANGLIALQKAAVPQAVMDAMISAAKNRSGAGKKRSWLRPRPRPRPWVGWPPIRR